MSKYWKFIVVMAVAGSLVIGTQARATTVTDIISDILDDMEAGPPVNHINPIVLEDDDFSQLVDVNANGFGDLGDIVRGIISFPAIWAGNPQDDLDPTNVGKSELLTPRRTLANFGIELTGVFEMEVIGHFPTATIPGLLLGPVLPASRSLLSSMVAGTMIEIYEDSTPDFQATASLAADVVFSQDGTLFAELGDTGAGTEFYKIAPVAGVPGITEAIEFALNFTVKPPPLVSPWNPPTMEPWLNSLGTFTYGFGTLDTAGTSGTDYQRTSDVDTIILYAPVPAAFGPGIALLGVLGMLYRRRRRA